jgi:hypothetical protein
VLDVADIVRDGDISTLTVSSTLVAENSQLLLVFVHACLLLTSYGCGNKRMFWYRAHFLVII